jgi:hypothetical protein
MRVTITKAGTKIQRKTGEAKAFQVETADGFKFWVQNRSVKGAKEVGAKVEVSDRVYKKAVDERAQFTREVKEDQARKKIVLGKIESDWENDKCAGFDIHDCFMNRRDRQRLRVFISKSKIEQGLTVGFVEWAIKKAAEKANAYDFVCGHGCIVDAIENATGDLVRA